jgi:hypothetical protein
MTMKHILRSLRRIARRALVALAVSGGAALVYGVAAVWLFTRSAPTTLVWLLIGPLSGAIALLSASVTLAIGLAPALAVARFLRYLERLPALLAARPRMSNRELAERLECSESEINDLRRLIAGFKRVQGAMSALSPARAPEQAPEQAA